MTPDRSFSRHGLAGLSSARRFIARHLVVPGAVLPGAMLATVTLSSVTVGASLIIGSFVTGCATMGLKSAVDMTVTVAPSTPKSALVYFDEKYIGTLAAVEARGVRVPEGQHRITIEKTGYFPVDLLVVSRVQPIELRVEMLKLPE